MLSPQALALAETAPATGTQPPAQTGCDPTTTPTQPTQPTQPGGTTTTTTTTPTQPTQPGGTTTDTTTTPTQPTQPGGTTTTPPAQPGCTPATPTTPQFPPPPALPAAPTVRVGLDQSLGTLSLSAAGGLYVVSKGAVVAQTQPAQAINITLVNGKLKIDTLATPVEAPVRFTPVPPKDPAVPNYMVYDKLRYRGDVEIVIAPKDLKLSVVNVVNLEDYLLGVVPREMPAGWPVEALKAQAVAARNYVLWNKGKWSQYGYDVTADTNDQAYGGVDYEDGATTGAVRATAGKLMTYLGKPIPGYYFASSGGYTENSEIIWTSRLDYLRGVPDFDKDPKNSYFSWTYSFDVAKFVAKVKGYKGKDVGTLTAVAPAGVMGISGRPSAWLVTGTTSSVTLRGEEMRGALGIPSSPKQINVQIATPPPPPQTAAQGTVSVIGADGKVTQLPLANASVVGAAQAPAAVPATQVTAVGANGTQVAIQTAAPVVQAPPQPVTGSVEVVGGGHGHAVGLSQWGAKGYAIFGKSYEEILAYYYKGSKVENVAL